MKSGTNRGQRTGNLPGIICSFALMLGLSASVNAIVIHVPDNYGSIQAAVNAAAAGDTILVSAGTYSESITINKALTITGDRGDVAVAGPGTNAPVLDGSTLGNNKWGFKIVSSDVVIEGFEIRNFGASGDTDEDGIQCWDAASSRVIIRDNFIHHIGYAGVLSGNGWGGAQGLHANWTVSYNAISDCGAYPLDLENVKDTIIADNTITQLAADYAVNVIALATENGVGILSTNITVHHNTIQGGSGPCINLFSWTENATATAELRDVVIADNTITANKNLILAWKYVGAGGTASIGNISINNNRLAVNNPSASYYAINLADVGGVSEMKCNVLNLTGVMAPGATWFHGVNISGNDTRSWNFEANQLNGHGLGTDSVGIRVRSTLPAASVLTLTGNILSGFAKGVSADTLATGLGFIARGNSICGNTQYGVANGSGAVIDARSNWWGAASGPSGVAPGTGDAVTLNVLYTPWITTPPDYAIASIRFAPSTLTPGCSFTAYVTVTNCGGSAAGNAGNLEIWVNRYAWATDSNGDASAYVGILAVGESKELCFAGLTAPTRLDGTYHFRAFVDSDNGICEFNEDNNQTTKPYLYASAHFKDKADFAITGASGTVEPWAPAPVGVIYGSITIANTGTAGGDAGRVTYWSDWDWSFLTLAKQPFGDLGGNVGWLNPGESRTYVIDGLMPAATYGTHTLLFFVDSNQATDEYSEWNNLLPFTYEFTGNPSNYKEIPDFAITNIVLNPANPGPGEVFDAYIYIVNSGYAAGSPGNLSVWISRSEWASNAIDADVTAPVASLAAGESRTLHFAGLTAPSISSGRTHHFRAFIDSGNGTTETSEGNNQLTSFYYFGTPSYGDKPDLSIIGLSVSPSPLVPNCAFTTTVTVANSGPVASSGCNLAIWADHVAAASNEIGAAIATIGPLNPGEVTTVSVSGLTTPSTGWMHTLRAFVDSSALIEEQSEGNNQMTIFYEYSHP